MKNILIIGNGFDLYHGLPTRYTDFLFFVNHWIEFCELLDSTETNRTVPGVAEWKIRLGDMNQLNNDSIEDFAKYFSNFSSKEFSRIDQIVRNNKWISHFNAIESNGDKWIDFENEIKRVLMVFEKTIKELEDYPSGRRFPDYSQETFSVSVIRRFVNNDKPVLPLGPIERGVARDLINAGVVQDISNQLLVELNDLIYLLHFYLYELVSNIKIETFSEQLDQLDQLKVLSFNYTDTFSCIYGNNRVDKNFHAHGSLVENNLVLGVGDDVFDNLDFVYFQKYFQRIQKRTGSFYREWLPSFSEPALVEDSEVYIMGHSLDPVDNSILNFFLNNNYVSKIHVFYHSENSYEDLVINLIKLIGKEQTIEQVGNGRIEFVKLKKPELRDGNHSSC